MLSIAAAGTNLLLRGDLTGGDSAGSSSISPSAEPDMSRACSSKGTIFEKIDRPALAAALFEEKASEIVQERWELLSNPNLWPCTALSSSIEPEMPTLKKLAESMPGWTYDFAAENDGEIESHTATKPVTFDSFSSILSELEREYECKLIGLQGDVASTVFSNNDIEDRSLADPSDVEFCCSATGGGCVGVKSIAEGTCDAGKYRGTDPLCHAECAVDISGAQLGNRAAALHRDLFEKRQQARTAVERTLLALRSLEMHLPFTLRMRCAQLAALNLKDDLTEAADAISCMPKIWDAGTSLHDRYIDPAIAP